MTDTLISKADEQNLAKSGEGVEAVISKSSVTKIFLKLSNNWPEITLEFFILIKWVAWHGLEEEVLKKSNLDLINGKELSIATTNKIIVAGLEKGMTPAQVIDAKIGKGIFHKKLKESVWTQEN